MGWLQIERPVDDHDRVVLRAREDDRIVASADARKGNDTWSLDVTADRGVGHRVLHALVDQMLRATREHGGGSVHWWSHAPDGVERAVALEHGLRQERELFQMRRPLPLEPEVDRAADGLAVRAFEPGKDEAAWVRVNNRAFEAHPEQGGWTVADVQAREAEPWFAAEGFLLHEVDGELAAFCWTKVHDREVPPLGEIYVIAVDPAFHGRGLGRAMTVAGLRSLAQRGIPIGMLYVDAANVAAVHLYYDLGFAVHSVRRAFVLEDRT